MGQVLAREQSFLFAKRRRHADAYDLHATGQPSNLPSDQASCREFIRCVDRGEQDVGILVATDVRCFSWPLKVISNSGRLEHEARYEDTGDATTRKVDIFLINKEDTSQFMARWHHERDRLSPYTDDDSDALSASTQCVDVAIPHSSQRVIRTPHAVIQPHYGNYTNAPRFIAEMAMRHRSLTYAHTRCLEYFTSSLSYELPCLSRRISRVSTTGALRVSRSHTVARTRQGIAVWRSRILRVFGSASPPEALDPVGIVGMVPLRRELPLAPLRSIVRVRNVRGTRDFDRVSSSRLLTFTLTQLIQ